MANIKKLYSSDGTTQIMPQTHERAVVDNNGTTAETKFKMITDLVNQKQMEVGAVPSDLTPTDNSTNWPTSGGVKAALEVVNDNYTYQELSISRAYFSISSKKEGYMPTALGLSANTTYKVVVEVINTTTNTIGIYVRQVANSSSVQKWVCTVPSGVKTYTTTFTTDPDNYQYLGWWSNENVANTISIYFYETKKIENEQTFSEEPIWLGNETPINCYLYTNNNVASWQNGINENYGRFYPVEANCSYKIVTSNNDTRVAFLTDNTHVAGEISTFANGWNFYLSLRKNKEFVLTAPNNAEYLFINTHSAYGDISPQKIVKLGSNVSFLEKTQTRIDITDLLPDYTVTNPTPINVDALLVQNAALGSNKKWTYNSANGYGKHKALSVVAGEKYVIHGDGSNAWGWVTSSYNPPYSNDSNTPYVSGCDREWGETVVRTVPEGAAYMILGVVNGAGGVGSWKVFKVDSYAEKKGTDFTKFRFANWNIGIFEYVNYHTTHTTSQISDDDADQVALEFKKIIDKTGANIFGICEYDTNYPRHSSSGLTKDIIFQCFKQSKIGTFYGNAACNALFFNSPKYVIMNEKIFDHTVKKDIDSSAAQRYYIDVLMKIAGKEVHIIETHLDWQNDEIKALQIAELISATASYDRVIIGGDFNTNTANIDTEVAPFIAAGFTLANAGYIGSFVTHEDNLKLDNIAVRGFAMTNIQVDEAAGNLSDHWILSCDLEML